MNIDHRLRKLELSGPGGYWDPIVELIVEEGETAEEVTRRHFGEEGPSENTLVVLTTIVSPNSPSVANTRCGLSEGIPGYEH